MREQHLNLFVFPARPLIKLCADQRADDIPGLFEDPHSNDNEKPDLTAGLLDDATQLFGRNYFAEEDFVTGASNGLKASLARSE